MLDLIATASTPERHAMTGYGMQFKATDAKGESELFTDVDELDLWCRGRTGIRVQVIPANAIH